MLKSKSKIKITMGPGTTYNQCFSSSNFVSQYEDECPVNYSLKYSETESCKGANKSETTKKKFKDYTDYTETDLDQPTNFSLKYAEKTSDDENKTTAFNDYNNEKDKFKEYSDYVETDLDQPTDFTLKYRESVDEDAKNLEFGYYENEEQKCSTDFSPQALMEESTCGRLPERYASQNETPLMFSRSSSMNSLSSFVHITQSIPDDRSSVVSDFSRMTSGIISPSELPDSPTQTAPSSPKRHKLSVAFSAKPDVVGKQSVFEDDVATYKQEGTPVEYSRSSSLSFLNADNLKSESSVKCSTTLGVTKEGNQNCFDITQPENLKQQIQPEKIECEKGKFELASVLEVDESLFADCISIDIQINCRKPKLNYGKQLICQETNAQLRPSNGFPGKPNFRLRFHNENRKGYPADEGSDDVVHTYQTEGTPANVSHAGSHSDLSALSIASGASHVGVDDNSDNESFFPENTENVSVVKPRLDYIRKDHQLTARDETASFAIENSPFDFSSRSSLSDLTVNLLDSPLGINRTEICEELPSHMLSPLRNVSPQSPNSIVFEEAEETVKCLDKPQTEFVSSEILNEAKRTWELPSAGEQKAENDSQETTTEYSEAGTVDSVNFDFDSNQPLSPFEEALLEECIRLGMPQKKDPKQLKESRLKSDVEGQGSERRDEEKQMFSKSAFEELKHLNENKVPPNNRSSGYGSLSSRTGESPSKGLNIENFDFDSSEPLTPFEEVLLEQCIRLGMPQKKNSSSTKQDGNHVKYSDEGTDNFDCGQITPLETALLNQCIRLGMPQRKNQKRREGNALSCEPLKSMSCLGSQLNKLKLSPEDEKDKDLFKKCDNCSCGKRHNNRKKSTTCKKSKSRSEPLRVESCPV